MSMSIYACWKGPLAVTRDRLQAALAGLGFQATILHELEGAEGYWPVDIDGCKTGVEIYFDSDLGELSGGRQASRRHSLRPPGCRVPLGRDRHLGGQGDVRVRPQGGVSGAGRRIRTYKEH